MHDYDDEALLTAAQVSLISFPALGPVDWLSCGRAIFSSSASETYVGAVGLSHQRRVDAELQYLGVHTERQPGSRPLTVMLDSRYEDWRRTHVMQPSVIRIGEAIVSADIASRDGEWCAAIIWNDLLVTLYGHAWPTEELALTEVDVSAYLEDSMLQHWR